MESEYDDGLGKQRAARLPCLWPCGGWVEGRRERRVRSVRSVTLLSPQGGSSLSLWGVVWSLWGRFYMVQVQVRSEVGGQAVSWATP